MENKLVFKPQTLIAYNWNKYKLIEDKTYKWDKYNTAPEYLHHYFWDKHNVIRNTKFYVWDVYDEEDNYLGEIGSYTSSQYPENGITQINGYTRKTVYKEESNSANNIHIWDEYNPIYKYNKIEVYQPYEYTFNKYQANYLQHSGLKCKWLNEGSGGYHPIGDYSYYGRYGTAAVLATLADVYPFDTTGQIIDNTNLLYHTTYYSSGTNASYYRKNIYPYLCNPNSRKFYLTKDKPYTANTRRWDGTDYSDDFYYLLVRNTIEVDLDSLNNEILKDYINQGYIYWIPDINKISTQEKTGEGIYFELVKDFTYFFNDRLNGKTLANVVVRTTPAHYLFGNLSSIDNSVFGCGDIIPYNSTGSDIALIEKDIAHQAGIKVKYDYYNLNFSDEPIEIVTQTRDYPVDEFYNGYYYDCTSMVPIGDRTYGDILDTFYSSERLNEDFLPNQNYTYKIVSINSNQLGDFIGTQYTGVIPTGYTDLIFISDSSGKYMAPYYNPITNTFWIYKGLADNRYKHKWNRYRKNINTSGSVSTFQWYHNTWDMSIQELKDETILLATDILLNTISEDDILKRENNTLYIKCRNIKALYPFIMGQYNYVNARHVDNEEDRVFTLKVKYDYYCENTLPAFFTPSMTIDDYHYIKVYLEGNTITGGETFLFCEDLYSNTPYAYPGDFIEEVYSLDINAYPHKGVAAEYLLDFYSEWYIPEGTGDYYIYQGLVDNDGIKGDFIESVETNTPNVYPINAIQNGFWYVYKPSSYYKNVSSWIRQDKTGVVTSLNDDTIYPHSGIWPDDFNDGYPHYYYVYTGYTSAYGQGLYDSAVKTYIRTSYPDNSYVINDGWYIYAGETIEQTAELTIDKTQLMGGVNYTQEINPSEDLLIGATGSAQVDFTIYAPDAAAATQYLGKDFEYYVKMNSDSDWRKIGTFILTTAELPDKQTAKIQGFDFINRFDVIVDEWLFNLSFPLTLGELFVSLCEYVGCEAYSTSFTNSDFLVNDNFEAVQITGRTILQYITEVSGGFCVAEPDGRIRIRYYAKPKADVNLGNNSYKKYTHEIYNVPVITSVIVRKDDNDEGVESNV